MGGGVDFIDKTCTCRKWELTDLPCFYACAAFRVEKYDFLLHVDDFYKYYTYVKSYDLYIQPVPSTKK